ALAGIERDTDPSGELDPRPTGNSPAFTAERAAYTDSYFTPANFIGAFGRENWMLGWTALDNVGYLGDLADGQTVSVEPIDDTLPEAFVLEQNYPNPFNPVTAITYQVTETAPVRIAVYDMMGRQVAVLVDGQQAAGTYRVTFDGQNLASGLYLYRLQAGAVTLSRTMTLLK
ncbi:MAG: T9SS type A sorting domain-containing protein, partial [Bacteroidota bacterium]